MLAKQPVFSFFRLLLFPANQGTKTWFPIVLAFSADIRFCIQREVAVTGFI
jgi:hypothetical protein